MKERLIDVPTRDGSMDTFITHPEEGGPFPAVIVYMDFWGLREELFDIARRIATVGYYCVIPNFYHRQGKIRFEFRDERGKMISLDRLDRPTQERILTPLNKLSNAMVVDDTGALIAFMEAGEPADTRAIGSVGYCMGGRHVLCAAGHFPDRFVASAALHGTLLMSDAPDSPHRLAHRFRGEIYCGFGAHDHYTPPELVSGLAALLASSGAKYRYLVHQDATHGYALPDRDVFDKHAANRDWERIFAMYARQLQARTS